MYPLLKIKYGNQLLPQLSLTKLLSLILINYEMLKNVSNFFNTDIILLISLIYILRQ